METRTRELLGLADCQPISRTSERTCLKGVSQKMAEWYPQCFPSDFLHLPVHTCTPTSRCTHINTKHKKENDSCEKQTIIYTIHSHAKKKQRFKNDLLSLSKTKKELNHRPKRPIVSQEDTGLGWSHLIMKQTSKTKNSLDRLDQIVLYMGRKKKLRSPQKAPYNDLRQRNKKYNRRMLHPGKLA